MDRSKKIIFAALFIGVVVAFTSLQRELMGEEKEDLSVYDFSKVTKGLPSSWGKLIRSGDLIPATERAYTVSLTFEDERGTIRLVYARFELEAKEIPEVHYVPKKFSYQVFVLPRDKSK